MTIILIGHRISRSLEQSGFLFFILAHVLVQQIMLNSHKEDFNILNVHIFLSYSKIAIIFEYFVAIYLNFIIVYLLFNDSKFMFRICV